MNPSYKSVLPSLSDSELEALKRSIESDGLHFPIIVNRHGIVLDGHNRLKACQELGIEPRFEVRRFHDKLLERKFVIVANLRRRNLNDFQRVELSKPLLDIERGLASQRKALAGKSFGRGKARHRLLPSGRELSEGEAVKKVAHEIGVSARSYYRALSIMQKESKGVKEKLRNGELEINTAYRTLQSKEKRLGPAEAVCDYYRTSSPKYIEADGLHIMRGNAKIASSVAVFSVPPVTTCPGMDWEKCGKICYSMKAELWPHVLDAWMSNLRESTKATFVTDVVALLLESGVKAARVHEAGDWFRQDYVSKFAEIARQLPKIQFFTYTKSLNLNLTALTSLPNFTVILSEGGKWDSKINKQKDNYSRVVQDVNQVEEGEFLCPEIKLGRNESEKFCGHLCDYCLSDKEHKIRVVFLEKKAGWNGNQLPPRPPIFPPRQSARSTSMIAT